MCAKSIIRTQVFDVADDAADNDLVDVWSPS